MPGAHLAACLLACLWFSPSALAMDWSSALTEHTVSPHVRGTDQTVLVVAAGEKTPALDQAAMALKDALRRSPSIKLVIGDEALGDLSGLDDAAIVRKASTQPVTQVIVLRVFPGRTTEEPGAVVTAYAKQGDVLESFTVLLQAQTGTQASSAGGGTVPFAGSAPAAGSALAASGPPAGATPATATSSSAETSAAEAQFQERSVRVKDRVGLLSHSVGYRGSHDEALRWPEFYTYIGQPEAAHKARVRRAVKTGLVVGGLGAAGAAIVVPLALMRDPNAEARKKCNPVPPRYDGDKAACKSVVYWDTMLQNTPYDMVLAYVPFIGVAFAVTPLALKADPTPRKERARMVEEFNQKLWRDLGLPDSSQPGATSEPPTRYPREQVASFELLGGPWVGYQSVGWSFTGVF
jgi:hypothetical protein